MAVDADGFTYIVVSSRSAAPRESANVPYHPGAASDGSVRWTLLRAGRGGTNDTEGSLASLGRIDASSVRESTTL